MTLKERTMFFRSQGFKVYAAVQHARAEQAAESRGLVCYWSYSQEEWDGDCEPPTHCLDGAVYRAKDMNHYDHPMRSARCLASLGMVGVNNVNDPYLRVCAAGLFIEALALLDAEDQREADKLAERATYAGVA